MKMMVFVLLISSSVGFHVPSSRVVGNFRRLRAVEESPDEKAVDPSEPLGELDGLDGWLIKMGLKDDERVSTALCPRAFFSTCARHLNRRPLHSFVPHRRRADS